MPRGLRASCSFTMIYRKALPALLRLSRVQVLLGNFLSSAALAFSNTSVSPPSARCDAGGVAPEGGRRRRPSRSFHRVRPWSQDPTGDRFAKFKYARAPTRVSRRAFAQPTTSGSLWRSRGPGGYGWHRRHARITVNCTRSYRSTTATLRRSRLVASASPHERTFRFGTAVVGLPIKCTWPTRSCARAAASARSATRFSATSPRPAGLNTPISGSAGTTTFSPDGQIITISKIMPR